MKAPLFLFPPQWVTGEEEQNERMKGATFARLFDGAAAQILLKNPAPSLEK